jgi:hypothetical protein
VASRHPILHPGFFQSSNRSAQETNDEAEANDE